MGVAKIKSTMEGAWTPHCNTCGIALCWDISQLEYEEEKEFWDRRECKECNPYAEGSRKRWRLNNEKDNY